MTDFLRNSWKSELCKGSEANADERYAFIGRNFTGSNNNGALIYHMLITVDSRYLDLAYLE